MSGFPILDLVIGIIFIYFLLSIISSSAVEMLLTGLRARAKLLEEWLLTIFNKNITQADGTQVVLGKAIMDHDSVTALSGDSKSNDYLSPKNFTSALLERITFDPANPTNSPQNIDDFITAISKTNSLPTEFQRVLLMYANDAKESYKSVTEKTVSEIDIFKLKVENWFNSSMDRITGALKKKYSRPITLFVAIIVTVFLNADSISLAQYLYSNPEARTKLAMEAYNSTTDTGLIAQIQKVNVIKFDSSAGAPNAIELKNEMIQKIKDINSAKQGLHVAMPLTWDDVQLKDANGNFSGFLIFSKITGLLATILAIMLGAPFWFDILNKVSNLRGTGTKPTVNGGN